LEPVLPGPEIANGSESLTSTRRGRIGTYVLFAVGAIGVAATTL
jgi:hypothetical protein